MMASICRLTYDCYDETVTVIEFYRDSFAEVDAFTQRVLDDKGTVEAVPCVKKALSDGVVEFCGSSDPLKITWGSGDRESVTMASSAKLNLMVETAEQRVILNDVFNGGWVADVYKDGYLYWHGQVTDTLAIESYRPFPYLLTLNLNDGLGETKANQFLTIDFPDPWPNNITVLSFLGKLINKYLYPSQFYKLFVSTILYAEGATDDGRQLEYTLLDPLTFMNNDDNQYIANSEVLESLLGIMYLKMFQWEGNWYIVSADANWYKGNISFVEYQVDTDTPVYVKDSVQELGILDLYSCTVNKQVGSSAKIDFMPSLRQVVLKQDFQMNTCILPAFANRATNFYSGFDGVELEFGPAPLQDRLNHWISSNFSGIPWEEDANTGYLQVPVKKSDVATHGQYAYVDSVLDDNVQFSKFFFAIKSIPTYKGDIDTLNGQYGIKRVVRIMYFPLGGGVPYFFWMNNPNEVNQDGQFPGWTEETEDFIWDHNNDISIEGLMPEDGIFSGGTFRFYFYNGYDDNVFSPDYSLLFSGLQLGVITSQFKALPELDKVNYLRKGIIPILGELLLSPMPVGVWTIYSAVKDGRQKRALRKVKDQIGDSTLDNYSSTDIDWEESVVTDINPNSRSSINKDYKIGNNLSGIESYHDIHISSFYDINYNALDSWYSRANNYRNGGEVNSNDLVSWRADNFLTNYMEYTMVLSGDWRAPDVSPFRIANDYEGQVYQPTKLVKNDKIATWSNVYTQFKALQGVGGLPVVCSYSPYEYDDSYCKGSGGVPVPGLQYDFTPGTNSGEAGFFDEFAVGSIAPVTLEGEVIYKLATFASNGIELSLGLPTQALLPNVSQINLHLLAIGDVVQMFPNVDSYQGTLTGVRDYLTTQEGNILKVTLEIIE